MRADDGGPGRERTEAHRPEDPLRLEPDVIIEDHVKGRSPRPQRLEHAPGEAAGPAEVGLLDEDQLVAEFGSTRSPGWAARDRDAALVDDPQGVEVVAQLGLGGHPGDECLDVVDLVDRGHADGQTRRP